jgi:multisubunit Na+/H+ antiporter MnhB subunit
MPYRLAADAILVVHAAFVAFVVLGLVAIVIGLLRRRRWVRNRWFRLAHLAAIVFVVLQAWMGRMCPLTAWENELRWRAGQEGYEGGFIAHWLGGLLFFDAPPWVFTLCYTAFGGLVVAVWIIGPPTWRSRRRSRGDAAGDADSSSR